MKTADTNLAAFNPVIPPGADPSLCPAKVEADVRNFASASDPNTGLYTFCTRLSNVENHAQLSLVPSLALKDTENQKLKFVHVSTSHQAGSFSIAVPVPPFTATRSH